MKALAAAIAEIKRQFPPQAEPGALQVIAGLIVVTLLLGAFFWVLESLWPEDRTQPRWRAASRTDLLYWFFDAFVDRRLVGVGVFLVVLALVLLRVPRANILVGHQPLGLQAIEALLLGDFIGYWVHRAMHGVPALWRLHAVHHSSTKPDWLAAARVHPLESIVSKLAAIVPMFLLGFSPAITAIYGPFLGFYPIFIHCNLRWGYGKLARKGPVAALNLRKQRPCEFATQGSVLRALIEGLPDRELVVPSLASLRRCRCSRQELQRALPVLRLPFRNRLFSARQASGELWD
jgi:sterol desaturase/sphingolipid hydroxylase (fatty acid hydroxylase superfamily)